MFEYQTAISRADRRCRSPTRRVYEGPSAVAAAGYLAKLRQRARARFVVSRGVHPHSPRDAGAPTRRLRHRGRRGRRCADGVTDAEALAAAIDDDTARGLPPAARTSSAPSRTSRRWRAAAKRTGALLRRAPCDPIAARHPRAARRVRRRRRRRRGPDARQPARLRRPVVRLLRRHRGATCAGCPAGSPARRPTSTAAAASCSRCRRASSTSAARRRPRTSAPRRRSTRWPASSTSRWLGRRGHRRARRAAARSAPPTRASALAALDGVELLHEQPVVREFARARSTRRSTRCSTAAPSAGVNPGYPLGRDYPEYEDGLLVAITERRSRADIDRLADVARRRGRRPSGRKRRSGRGRRVTA